MTLREPLLVATASAASSDVGPLRLMITSELLRATVTALGQ